MVSERTKKCRALKILFTVIHFIFMFGPLAYFLISGYIHGEIVEKISLSFTIIISIILLIVSILIDVKNRAGTHRAVLWILIAGILFCLEDIKTFIWIMAVASIVDELFILKIKDYYSTALISNKEIDRRN